MPRGFPNKILYVMYHVLHTCYTCLSLHRPSFDHDDKTVKCSNYEAPATSSLLRLNILLGNLFSNNLRDTIIIIITTTIIIALQPFVGPWPLFHFLDPIRSR
jgi:hypothetical protein